MQPLIRRLGLRILILVAALYGIALIGLFAFQHRLVFPGSLHPTVPCADMDRLGAVYDETPGPKGEEYRRFRWERPEGKAWVLLLHGNAKTACDRAFFLSGLYEVPLNWIVPEYPGYGGGQGEASVDGLLATAHLGLQEIRERNSAQAPIFVFGESLGTAVATEVAATSDGISGLILQTPFTRLGDVAQARYWFLPTSHMLRYELPADEWAKRVQAPVLIYHSIDDTVIPYPIGRRQTENFAKGLVEFHEYTNAGHVGFRSADGKRFWSMLRSFFERHMKGRGKS